MRKGIATLLLTSVGLAHMLSALARSPSRAQIPRTESVGQRYRAVPMSFESNQGQFEPEVRYLARGAGYAVLFKDREAYSFGQLHG
jgi:hypothetical protein